MDLEKVSAIVVEGVESHSFVLSVEEGYSLAVAVAKDDVGDEFPGEGLVGIGLDDFGSDGPAEGFEVAAQDGAEVGLPDLGHVKEGDEGFTCISVLVLEGLLLDDEPGKIDEGFPDHVGGAVVDGGVVSCIHRPSLHLRPAPKKPGRCGRLEGLEWLEDCY